MRYIRERFIAAQREKQILAPFCYRGTCDTVLFNMWVKDFLLPELKPGQVVIIDNAAFHKSQETKKLIKTAGCRVLFLSSYSRDLDPIEQVWASIKRRCKQCWKK
jgi:transposase